MENNLIPQNNGGRTRRKLFIFGAIVLIGLVGTATLLNVQRTPLSEASSCVRGNRSAFFRTWDTYHLAGRGRDRRLDPRQHGGVNVSPPYITFY